MKSLWSIKFQSKVTHAQYLRWSYLGAYLEHLHVGDPCDAQEYLESTPKDILRQLWTYHLVNVIAYRQRLPMSHLT